LHAINATKALVTDLYANKVWLIDRTSGIEKSFNVRGHCEQMTESNTEIAIACSKGVIYFFNKSTQQLTDSLETGMDTRQILSYNNTFYTLGSSGTNSAVFEISNHQKSLAWDTTTRKQKFSHFSYNAKTQLWVFLEGKKLVQMNKDFAAPRVQFEKADANFYNLMVNQTSGEIFISNAKDYVSSGELIHLAKDYSPIKTVSTGIIPGECLILD